MIDKHIILAVHITDRLTEALAVQKLLTEYGYIIKTRLGLHEIHDSASAPNGLLLLEMVGDVANSQALSDKINALEGVEAKSMVFEHPAP